MTNKICDCDGFGNFFVICDKISNIFCESQTEIEI
jgi:hypothetical protein